MPKIGVNKFSARDAKFQTLSCKHWEFGILLFAIQKDLFFSFKYLEIICWGISQIEISFRAGEMAQWSGFLAAPTEDLILVLSTHIRQLILSVIPVPRDLTPTVTSAGICTHEHRPTNRHTCIYIIRNKANIQLSYNCLLSHTHIIWSVDNYRSHQHILINPIYIGN